MNHFPVILLISYALMSACLALGHTSLMFPHGGRGVGIASFWVCSPGGVGIPSPAAGYFSRGRGGYSRAGHCMVSIMPSAENIVCTVCFSGCVWMLFCTVCMSVGLGRGEHRSEIVQGEAKKGRVPSGPKSSQQRPQRTRVPIDNALHGYLRGARGPRNMSGIGMCDAGCGMWDRVCGIQ